MSFTYQLTDMPHSFFPDIFSQYCKHHAAMRINILGLDKIWSHNLIQIFSLPKMRLFDSFSIAPPDKYIAAEVSVGYSAKYVIHNNALLPTMNREIESL